MKYIKHLENGVFTKYTIGDSSFGEAPGNQTYARMMAEVAAGTSTIVEQDDTHVPAVDELRQAEYGSWQDQMDEIYHDIDAWRIRIADVKARNPKP